MSEELQPHEKQTLFTLRVALAVAIFVAMQALVFWSGWL